jgi:hypothetical protein
MEPNFWAAERDGYFLTSSATTGFSMTLLYGSMEYVKNPTELINKWQRKYYCT